MDDVGQASQVEFREFLDFLVKAIKRNSEWLKT